MPLTKDPFAKDFKLALSYIWQNLGLPKPDKIQNEIADFLQENTSINVLIQAWRGIGKTWITAAYVAECLRRNPDEIILIVSATSNKAKEISSFIKKILTTMDVYKHLVPDGSRMDGVRTSGQAFDVLGCSVKPAPSVRAVGMTTQITGSRATKIIVDDMEIPENSGTADARATLMQKAKEFTNVLKPGGQIIYLGTPQSQETVYLEIMDRVDPNTGDAMYNTRVWTARYPSIEDINTVYNGRIAPSLQEDLRNNPELIGEPVCPERFDESVLLLKEADIGRKDFTLQFMLNPALTDAEKYPLKLQDLTVVDLFKDRAPMETKHSKNKANRLLEFPSTLGFQGDFLHKGIIQPEYVYYDDIIVAVDPSGRGNDETGYVVLGLLYSKAYLLKTGGLRDGIAPASLKFLANLALEYKASNIVVESNFGDGMYENLLVPYVNSECGIQGVKATNQTYKEHRILKQLEPWITTGKLIVDYQAVLEDLRTTFEDDSRKNGRVYSLFYQMTHICDERGALKHDDRLDALGIGLEYFKDRLALSEEAEREAMRSKMYEEIEEFFENALSNTNETRGNLRYQSLRRP